MRLARAPLVTLLLLLVVAAAAPHAARAQAIETRLERGVRYAQAEAVGRALGDILSAGEGSLTWRAAAGVLTVFEGSPDAVLQPTGAAPPRELGFAAPVRRIDGAWYLPLDAFEAIGLRVGEEALLGPDGLRLELAPAPPVVTLAADGRSEVADLGHGVQVLRFFAGGADGEDPQVSLMLADLDLLPLVLPGDRVAVDAAVDEVGGDKPLLVVVSARAPASWSSPLRFTQGGLELEVRYPYRMRLVFGDAAGVAPDAPVAALVLLPPAFSLYRPMRVEWQGSSGEITFRR